MSNQEKYFKMSSAENFTQSAKAFIKVQVDSVSGKKMFFPLLNILRKKKQGNLNCRHVVKNVKNALILICCNIIVFVEQAPFVSNSFCNNLILQ